MAQRRMFSQRIINSGKFLKMPQTSQALYFHLNINADDDGVVEAYKVIRMGGFGEDDLKVLATKRFIEVLNEDLVSYILDWKEHNLIRADRKIDSIYKNLLVKILPEVETIEAKPRADTGKKTGESKMDVHWTSNGPHRLGKVRLGKVRKVKVNKNIILHSKTKVLPDKINPLIEKFKNLNPNYEILFANKTQRGAVDRLIKKFGEDTVARSIIAAEKCLGDKYAPTITTPIQLESKFAQLVAYYKKEQPKGIPSFKTNL